MLADLCGINLERSVSRPDSLTTTTERRECGEFDTLGGVGGKVVSLFLCWFG